MKSVARKKVTPIPPASEADPDAARRWIVETPDGRVEIYADDCDIEHGILQFINESKECGIRALVHAFGPSGWMRLIPPPTDLDALDEVMHDAAAYASACANANARAAEARVAS